MVCSVLAVCNNENLVKGTKNYQIRFNILPNSKKSLQKGQRFNFLCQSGNILTNPVTLLCTTFSQNFVIAKCWKFFHRESTWIFSHRKTYLFPMVVWLTNSATRRKSPNDYKSCPKMISLEKLKILTPLQKLPSNKGDLGNLITGFEKLPKVQ